MSGRPAPRSCYRPRPLWPCPPTAVPTSDSGNLRPSGPGAWHSAGRVVPHGAQSRVAEPSEASESQHCCLANDKHGAIVALPALAAGTLAIAVRASFHFGTTSDLFRLYSGLRPARAPDGRGISTAKRPWRPSRRRKVTGSGRLPSQPGIVQLCGSADPVTRHESRVVNEPPPADCHNREHARSDRLAGEGPAGPELSGCFVDADQDRPVWAHTRCSRSPDRRQGPSRLGQARRRSGK